MTNANVIASDDFIVMLTVYSDLLLNFDLIVRVRVLFYAIRMYS